MQKIATHLWYDKEAAKLYVPLLEASKIKSLQQWTATMLSQLVFISCDY